MEGSQKQKTNRNTRDSNHLIMTYFRNNLFLAKAFIPGDVIQIIWHIACQRNVIDYILLIIFPNNITCKLLHLCYLTRIEKRRNMSVWFISGEQFRRKFHPQNNISMFVFQDGTRPDSTAAHTYQVLVSSRPS